MARRRRKAGSGTRTRSRQRYQFGGLQLCPCGGSVSGLGALGIDIPALGPRPALYTSQIDTPFSPRALSPSLPPLPSEHDEGPHLGVAGLLNTKTLIALGVAGVAGYFIYRQFFEKRRPAAASAGWAPSFTQPSNFVMQQTTPPPAPMAGPPGGVGFWH